MSLKNNTTRFKWYLESTMQKFILSSLKSLVRFCLARLQFFNFKAVILLVSSHCLTEVLQLFHFKIFFFQSESQFLFESSLNKCTNQGRPWFYCLESFSYFKTIYFLYTQKEMESRLYLIEPLFN